MWHGCWELKSSPLEEQQALLTTKASLHHPSLYRPRVFKSTNHSSAAAAASLQGTCRCWRALALSEPTEKALRIRLVQCMLNKLLDDSDTQNLRNTTSGPTGLHFWPSHGLVSLLGLCIPHFFCPSSLSSNDANHEHPGQGTTPACLCPCPWHFLWQLFPLHVCF